MTERTRLILLLCLLAASLALLWYANTLTNNVAVP
jgi:hypothetical protein